MPVSQSCRQQKRRAEGDRRGGRRRCGTDCGLSCDAAATRPAAGGPYNILFILTDQERLFRSGANCRATTGCRPTNGFAKKGHRLREPPDQLVHARRRAQCSTPACTSSRRGCSTTRTSLISSMSTDIPTIGHMLRDAGYYTAYKGKRHLTKEFETVNSLGTPEKIFTMRWTLRLPATTSASETSSRTRAVATCTTASSRRWASPAARTRFELAAQGKPWFLAVNLGTRTTSCTSTPTGPGKGAGAQHPRPHRAGSAEPDVCEAMGIRVAPHTRSGSMPPPAHGDYLRSHDTLRRAYRE